MDGADLRPDPGRHVLVIGGGATGALMALHLLRADARLRVTVVERSTMLGCGVAYATDNPDHLLNTRAHNMSAWRDDPDHFVRWLAAEEPGATPQCFVGRKVYGRYLAAQIAVAQGDRLRCVTAACLTLRTHPLGVAAGLSDGSTLLADRAVLATGHAVPAPGDPAAQGGLRGGWDFTPITDPGAAVVIVGTGLSMIDHVVALTGQGHRGPITAISRRGLLPQAHGEGHAAALDAAAVPVGAPVSQVLHWLRAQARASARDGGTWRDAVDAIRPHVSLIWQGWDEGARRRFLRHAASWWEVHRHRMPPQSAALIAAVRAAGQLRILRGRFEGIAGEGAGRTVQVATAGGPRQLAAAHVIDCRGIRRDPVADATPVVADLIATGAGRLDALGLGLDTDAAGHLIDADGTRSDRLFAVGPCARGALWEITAIPDIRTQCAALAAALAAQPATPR